MTPAPPPEGDYGRHIDRGPGFTHHKDDNCKDIQIRHISKPPEGDGLQLSKIYYEAINVYPPSTNDMAGFQAIEVFVQQLIAEKERVARHNEHFKTHCVTCGKYNQIDRPEDEDICQCE